MIKMTGGELLVETLLDLGVRNIFSIIGGQMCSIYEALSHHPEIKLVTLHNEAAAPMMAAGCTAVTGVPSVSMCTVGAGVVYEVAGLVASWYGYLPVISIAPQVQSWKMNPHQENLQGLNQDGIFAPITKWNAIIHHWERIPSLTQRALREALANAPGPVHLDIPVDVLFQTKKFDPGKKAKIMPPAANTRYVGSLPGPAEPVEKACVAISRAVRPLVLVGQGMGQPGRYPGLKEKLNEMGAPVLASDCSFGVMEGQEGCCPGGLGLLVGAKEGLALLKEADLHVVIGWDEQIKEALAQATLGSAALVQVETDPSALLTGRKNFIGVNADPISFLAAVKRSSEDHSGKWVPWHGSLRQTKEAITLAMSQRMPGYASLFKGISAGLGDDAVVVVDGAEPVEASRAFLRPAGRSQIFLMNTRDLAGVGLPFVLGAKIGMPARKLTLIADKDSLFRQIQELQTAVGLGLGITIICVDPGEGKSLARLEAVLDGLGCGTALLQLGESPTQSSSNTPFAWLCV